MNSVLSESQQSHSDMELAGMPAGESAQVSQLRAAHHPDAPPTTALCAIAPAGDWNGSSKNIGTSTALVAHRGDVLTHAPSPTAAQAAPAHLGIDTQIVCTPPPRHDALALVDARPADVVVALTPAPPNDAPAPVAPADDHTDPVAAGMLADFLSMAKGRAVAKKDGKKKHAGEAQREQCCKRKAEPAQGEVIGSKQAEQAPSEGIDAKRTRPSTDLLSKNAVCIKVDHEVTRSTFRVRMVVHGQRIKSQGIQYCKGDADSMGMARDAAAKLAREWAEQRA